MIQLKCGGKRVNRFHAQIITNTVIREKERSYFTELQQIITSITIIKSCHFMV